MIMPSAISVIQLLEGRLFSDLLVLSSLLLLLRAASHPGYGCLSGHSILLFFVLLLFSLSFHHDSSLLVNNWASTPY